MGRGECAETSATDRGGESIADVVIIGGPLTCLNVETSISGVKQQDGWCRPMKGRSRLSVKDMGYVSPRPSAIVSRSAFTVCSQACFDTAAQKKAQALHDPRRRDMLATD